VKKIGNYKMTDILENIIREVKVYSNLKDANEEDVLDSLRYAVIFYERKLNKIKEEAKRYEK
jgi:hypothetical protein